MADALIVIYSSEDGCSLEVLTEDILKQRIAEEHYGPDIEIIIRLTREVIDLRGYGLPSSDTSKPSLLIIKGELVDVSWQLSTFKVEI